MHTISDVRNEILKAWQSENAAPKEDMQYIVFEHGIKAAEAFIDVSPLDVDIASPGFLGATILLDIPSRAAAIYLGSYVMSFLLGMQYEEEIGIFHDFKTRVHLIVCLNWPSFWENVISLLSLNQLNAFLNFCMLIISRREMLAIDDKQVKFINSKVKALRNVM